MSQIFVSSLRFEQMLLLRLQTVIRKLKYIKIQSSFHKVLILKEKSDRSHFGASFCHKSLPLSSTSSCGSEEQITYYNKHLTFYFFGSFLWRTMQLCPLNLALTSLSDQNLNSKQGWVSKCIWYSPNSSDSRPQRPLKFKRSHVMSAWWHQGTGC